MRIAVTIIVILGALAAAGLGFKWVTDYNDYKDTLANVTSAAQSLGVDSSSELKEIEKMKNCGYILMVCGALAFVAVILIGKLKKISALIILLTVVVPAFIYPATLIVTFILAIGGIMAIFVKPKLKVAA